MPLLKRTLMARKKTAQKLAKGRIAIPSTLGPYKRRQYVKKAINLCLDLDGTLWAHYRKDQHPNIPQYFRAFIAFCLKCCQSVSINTFRTREEVFNILSEALGKETFGRLTIFTEQDSYYLSNHCRRFKIVKNFKAESTLIVDDKPGFYPEPFPQNILAPMLSVKDYHRVYQGIVDFIEQFTPKQSLRSQIEKFAYKSKVFLYNSSVIRFEYCHDKEPLVKKLTRDQVRRID